MIRSMTGFGRGEYSDEISKVTVEIRSVNHRYLDIYVKMPRRYSFAEETIKSAIKERLHRGKVEVSVSVDNIGKSDSDVRLDKELAARYYNVLSELKDSFDFGEDSRVEGEKLAADLSARADTIQEIRDRIDKRAPEIEKEYAAKFKARVEEILGGVYEVPEERIALEAAIFADKANITEELVRLGSHISQLRKFLKSDGKEAVGKKIDFLIQEMNREANTIGSKSNDREITSNMLDLKAEIEKVREQVQNIE